MSNVRLKSSFERLSLMWSACCSDHREVQEEASLPQNKTANTEK